MSRRNVNHVAEAAPNWSATSVQIPPELRHESTKGGQYARHNIQPGERFGELTTIDVIGRTANGSRVWICKCSCGGEAVRVASALNRSIRKGYSPCCHACLVELRGGQHAARQEALREAFRRQYVDYQTLWTGDQTSRLMDEILHDLETEFGPGEEEKEKLPIESANGWPYSARGSGRGGRHPLLRQHDQDEDDEDNEDEQPRLAADLLQAIGSGSREQIDQAIADNIEFDITRSRFERDNKEQEPVSTVSLRVHDGPCVRCCIVCGQRVVWRLSRGLCFCDRPCFRQYEKQLGLDTPEARRRFREERDRETNDSEVARHKRAARQEVLARLAYDHEERARQARDSEAKSLALLVPADVLGRTVESLQRQFVEQHNIETYFVRASVVRGYLTMHFTMTNRHDQSVYVIQYGDRHAWMLGASSATQAVSEWLAQQSKETSP